MTIPKKQPFNNTKKSFKIHKTFIFSIWTTDEALNQLVKEKKLKTWKKRSKRGINVSFFRNNNVRYFERNAQKMLDLIDYYNNNDLELGKYAEHLAEKMFYKLKFDVEDKNANEFNGKKWNKSNHNLDLIVSKDGLFYGVEVKNRFEYIKTDEFEIKMFKICSHLNLIPILIVRMIPKKFYMSLTRKGGFAFIFKRKVFPFGQKIAVKNLYKNTLLPVGVDDKLSEKKEKKFVAN